MNVSLTPELEAFVREKVDSGRYTSSSEVVREALRLLEREERWRAERLAELRREIKIGIDQLDRGEYSTATAEDIIRMGRERLKKNKQNPKGHSH